MTEYPSTHWTILIKMVDYLDDAKHDAEISKEDVCAFMEGCLAEHMQKILAHPTTSNYCLFKTEQNV